MNRLDIGMPVRSKKQTPGAEATDKERLRVNDLLIGLDDVSFNKFAKRCEFIPFNKGDVLLEEGASLDFTYLVIKGRVRVVQRDEGNVDIVYREIFEGGWFGEIAAFDKGRRTAAVHAMTDGVMAAMPRAVFLNLILEQRQIAVKVLESLAGVIRSSNRRFSEVSSYSGVQRVYLRLLEIAESDPMDDSVLIIDNMPSHVQLANDAMTSKEAVARAISQILQENVAKRITGKLKITQPDTLKRLATQV